MGKGTKTNKKDKVREYFKMNIAYPICQTLFGELVCLYQIKIKKLKNSESYRWKLLKYIYVFL